MGRNFFQRVSFWLFVSTMAMMSLALASATKVTHAGVRFSFDKSPLRPTFCSGAAPAQI